MSAWTRTRCASSATVVAAVLSIVVAYGTAASAAEVPVDPNIARAADQLNSILPPPMPQQTIKIGRFDGQTKAF